MVGDRDTSIIEDTSIEGTFDVEIIQEDDHLQIEKSIL